MAFIRRFLFDPGNTVLLEIESVNILDLEPPADLSGVGSGVALVVGEFENGPFNTPYQVGSATDMLQTFGGLGYTYGGVPSNNPCAVSRAADGAVTPEYWNGNGFIQLNGKKFAGLVVCRVDTSVGSVQFTRLAALKGTAKFTYKLASGQTLKVNLGAGNVTATFTAVAATLTSIAGTFAMAAGDTVTFGVDGMPNFTVTFFGTDTTNLLVLARINLAAGFTFAANSAGQIAYTGRQKGTGGQIRVVSSSTPGVLTALGLAVGNTAGTGNVVDIDNVTLAEAHTVVSAAVAGTAVEKMSDGTPRLVNTATPGTGTISVDATSTAVDFGFPTGVNGTAAAGSASGVIPAGTRVRNTGATVNLVTMQDLAVSATNAGPYTVKVRHATDDGTGIAAVAGNISVVSSPIDLDSFTVLNPFNVSAALLEPAIDAQYIAALASTKDVNTVGKIVNMSWSARQSNLVRRALKQNALDASAGGCQGRITVLRPPMNTLKAVAKGAAEPGVQPYRDQRVIYTYPNVSSNVPAIAFRGLAGGAGFTASGTVDIGSDGFLIALMTQLPPEENPGQDTPFTGGVLAIESGANCQGFAIDDYKQFKAAGVCAPILFGGICQFESGVTSVDPLVNPSLKTIARRRMADFIQDTLALRLTSYVKKLNTNARRIVCSQEIRAFMRGLMGLSNPVQQRIAGFTLDDKSGNTGASIALGMYRIILKVRTLASMDSIVLQSTIGEGVTVTELAPGEIQ